MGLLQKRPIFKRDDEGALTLTGAHLNSKYTMSLHVKGLICSKRRAVMHEGIKRPSNVNTIQQFVAMTGKKKTIVQT